MYMRYLKTAAMPIRNWAYNFITSKNRARALYNAKHEDRDSNYA